MSNEKPKFIPIAPHFVEPYDGHDRMVVCVDCKGSERKGHAGEFKCLRFVPSMAHQQMHCQRFRGRA